MKKASLSILATIALGFVALFTACSSDSDDVPANTVDSNAGEFKIINTTRGNIELTDGSVELFKGDVLKIQFSPKYSKNFTTNYSVSIDNGASTQITDKDSKYTIGYGDKKYTFTLTAKFDDGGTHLSASKTITVTQKYNVTIPYVLYMTEDLAELINITFEYSKDDAEDADKDLVSKIFQSNDIKAALVTDSVKIYEYEEDGVIKHTFSYVANADDPDDKYKPVKVLGISKLVFPIAYYIPNINTKFKVSFSRTDTDLDPNKTYFIGCRLERQEASIDYPTKNGVKAKDNAYEKVNPMIMEDADSLNADKVRDFLNKELPNILKEEFKLRIDKEGNVNKR